MAIPISINQQFVELKNNKGTYEGGKLPYESEYEQEAFEIASAIHWETLSPSVQRGVAEMVGKQPKTYCGAWITAMAGGHAAAAELLSRMQAADLPSNRKLIASLLKLNSSGLVRNGGAKCPPCPDIPELLSQFFSISVPQIKTTTKQKANE